MKKEALFEVTLQHASNREESNKKGARLVRGTIMKVINEALTDHDLPDGSINKDSARSRMRKKCDLTPKKPGPPSPLADIEDILVAMLIEKAAMSQPLSTSNGLKLANSLTKDAKYQQQLLRHHPCNDSTIETTPETVELSAKYW